MKGGYALVMADGPADTGTSVLAPDDIPGPADHIAEHKTKVKPVKLKARPLCLNMELPENVL